MPRSGCSRTRPWSSSPTCPARRTFVSGLCPRCLLPPRPAGVPPGGAVGSPARAQPCSRPPPPPLGTPPGPHRRRLGPLGDAGGRHHRLQGRRLRPAGRVPPEHRGGRGAAPRAAPGLRVLRHARRLQGAPGGRRLHPRQRCAAGRRRGSVDVGSAADCPGPKSWPAPGWAGAGLHLPALPACPPAAHGALAGRQPVPARLTALACPPTTPAARSAQPRGLGDPRHALRGHRPPRAAQDQGERGADGGGRGHARQGRGECAPRPAPAAPAGWLLPGAAGPPGREAPLRSQRPAASTPAGLPRSSPRRRRRLPPAPCRPAPRRSGRAPRC